MLLPSETNYYQFVGNGTQTIFPCPNMPVLSSEDVKVILRKGDGSEQELIIGSHYTLSGVGDPNGFTVTMLTPPAGVDPAAPIMAAEKLNVRRVVALKQEYDYVEGGKFPADSHENGLTRAMMACQQLQEQLSRSPRFPLTGSLRNIALPLSDGFLRLNAGLIEAVNTIIVNSADSGILFPAPGSGLAGIVSKVAEAAGQTRLLCLTPGVWEISQNYEFPSNIIVEPLPGAILITDNALLKINKFVAGLQPCFVLQGSGAVQFAKEAVDYVRPEWWYDGGVSWHNALNAAYKAFTGSYLVDFDYDVNTGVIDRENGNSAGYVSMLLSQKYTVTNFPFLLDDVRSGQIVGVGRGKSGIYQSGTGDTVQITWPSPIHARMVMKDFTIEGNPLSQDGINSNVACLEFERLNLFNHGRHGFNATANGWWLRFRDVLADYNGGDGLCCTGIGPGTGDNLIFLGGSAQYNGGKGINWAVTSTGFANQIKWANISYNLGGGIYGQYGQYILTDNYLEGNWGKQISLWNLIGGRITDNVLYDLYGKTTHGIHLNSDYAAPANTPLTVKGNKFKGNTINVWSSGNVRGATFGPNQEEDGVNQIFPDTTGFANTIITKGGGIIYPLYNLTYSASITPDLSRANDFVITVTDGNPFTLNAPTNPSQDNQPVTITIVNNSGGAMGAITWNGAYRLAGAFVNPADGYERSITFRVVDSPWDTKLVEHHRTLADVDR